MRETHVPLESVWERLVRAVEEGSKRPSKSLKGSKLRRTSNLTFLKTGLKLHTKKQCLRLSLRTIEYATNTYKRYFYTFKINQSTFTYGEGKGTAWLLRNVQSKFADFCCFHIENEATTMQCNRSAHTAWFYQQLSVTTKMRSNAFFKHIESIWTNTWW